MTQAVSFIQRELDLCLDRVAHIDLQELSGCRFFITGGSGFLGSWLVDLLIAANRAKKLGLQIVVLTRDSTALSIRRPDWALSQELQLITGDVSSFQFPPGMFSHVIHAAADTSSMAAQHPLTLATAIVDGSRRVLDFARQSGVRRYLYVSSGAAVVPPLQENSLIHEDDFCAPSVTDANAAYGNSKRFAEHLHSLYCEPGELDVIIARGFAFVGPRMPLDGHFAIGNFILDAVNGVLPRLNSDGTARRSYLCSTDAAVWLLVMLIRGCAGRVYNLGSDYSISVLELANRVSQVLGLVSQVRPPHGVSAGLRKNYVPDITRSRNELGLEPWTSLDDSILLTATWARRRLVSQGYVC